jgi:hypothetical protein
MLEKLPFPWLLQFHNRFRKVIEVEDQMQWFLIEGVVVDPIEAVLAHLRQQDVYTRFQLPRNTHELFVLLSNL